MFNLLRKPVVLDPQTFNLKHIKNHVQFLKARTIKKSFLMTAQVCSIFHLIKFYISINVFLQDMSISFFYKFNLIIEASVV